MLKVTGLKLNHGRPNAKNNRILAYFDCKLPGIRLNGCALVWTHKDQMRMWAPRIEGADPHGRSVEITDWQLMLQIRNAAAQVYLALDGAESEWVRAQLAAESVANVATVAGAQADAEPETVATVASVAEGEGVRRFLGVVPA